MFFQIVLIALNLKDITWENISSYLIYHFTCIHLFSFIYFFTCIIIIDIAMRNFIIYLGGKS